MSTKADDARYRTGFSSLAREGARRHSVAVRHSSNVFAQQILSEVAIEVTPHGVNVVRVVLRVVVLDQEGWSLHTIVVFLSPLE